MTDVDVKGLLDPELGPILGAFELPQMDADAVAAIRSAPFPAPALSGAVTRTEHEVPGDPPVPVRLHRPIGRRRAASRHGHDAWRRLCHRFLRHGRPATGPLVSVPGVRRRLGRVPIGARDAVPRTARRLLRRPALDPRPRRRPGHRPFAHRHLRTECRWGAGGRARPAGPRPRRGSTSPSNSSTAPCSTGAGSRRPSGRRGSTCGTRRRTSSAGARTWVTSTAATTSRPTRRPRGATDLAGLPPTCVVVGAIDGFRDENIDYAQRLCQAGVDCELHVIAGLPPRTCWRRTRPP